MQQYWAKRALSTLSFFPKKPKVLKKSHTDQVKTMNSTVMTRTFLVPRVAAIIKTITISDFLEKRSFEKSINQAYPLLQGKTLTFAVSIIIGNNYVIQAFRNKLPHLPQAWEGSVLYQINSLPERSGVAVVLDRILIDFKAL